MERANREGTNYKYRTRWLHISLFLNFRSIEERKQEARLAKIKQQVIKKSLCSLSYEFT